MTHYRHRLLALLLPLMAAGTTSAQVINFTLDGEAENQNTPEGWTPVELPKGLPTFTEENTFYITDSRFGASTTAEDNTTAIQAALDAADAAGGGMVVIPTGEFVSNCITVGSKTVVHLCEGATLTWLGYDFRPHNEKVNFIQGKTGASDIVIEGESRETSIIEGQGGPWWDAREWGEENLQRGSMIRFSQGNRYLFRNFRMQNAPGTNLTAGQSGNGAHTTIHDVTILAPSSQAEDPSHNTDGIPIWTQYVNVYNCLIDTGDDNVVTDSHAQFVHVWNCQMKAGHGASLGSYTENMHDILYEDLTFDGTGCGFRLKSNVGRSGDVYNIVFRNCTMTNVMNPIQITAWYDTLPTSPSYAAENAGELEETTPRYHDILIQNVTARDYIGSTTNPKNGYGVFVYGRPESPVRNVTLDNVKISHSKGMKLNFCEGIRFVNGCSFTNTSSGISSTEEELPASLIEEGYSCEYTWNQVPVETTISTIRQESVTNMKSVFDLQGRSISNLNVYRPGIYIHNGRKKVLKW